MINYESRIMNAVHELASVFHIKSLCSGTGLKSVTFKWGGNQRGGGGCLLMHGGWFKDKWGLAMRSCGAERGVVEGVVVDASSPEELPRMPSKICLSLSPL